MFSIYGFNLILILIITQQSIATCDLSIFPEGFQPDDTIRADLDYEDKLYLFSNSKSNTEQKECTIDQSSLNKETLCEDYCSEQVKLVANSCVTTNVIDVQNQTKSTVNKPDTLVLNTEGLLIYYRKFVHTFLDHLKNEDIDTESLDFNINILLTKHQTKRLRLFCEALNDTDAGVLIQETTDILNNMFQIVQPNIYQSQSNVNISEYVEEFSKRFVSILMDSRIQITLFSLITITIMFGVLFRQICRYKFSIRTLLLFLFILAFIVSIVNNHLLLIQKKQILKQQMLKESIPEECFLSATLDNKNEPVKTSFLNSAFSHFKSYFKHKPTSQKCLDYHEALLLDAKQANFIETILFTISESFRPISMIFGESINQFYSALTKNLSFYQYIPLIFFVTSILVPIMVFMMSFLSLLLFDYEFNFFHLISLRKNKQATPTVEQQPAIQQADLFKVLDILKRENDQLNAKCLTASMTSSTNIKVETLKPVPHLSIEPIKKVEEKHNESIDLNESITIGVESLIKNKKNREKELLKIIEDLKNEKKVLNEMVSSRIDYKELIRDTSSFLDSTSEEPFGETVTYKSKIVTIGSSKQMKDDLVSFTYEEKSLTDNNYADDDEDIVVILDEK